MSAALQDILDAAYAAGYNALSDRELRESIAAAACEGGAWIATISVIDFVSPDYLTFDGWNRLTGTFYLMKYHGDVDNREYYCAVTNGSRAYFTQNGENAVPGWVDLNAVYYLGSVVDDDTRWTFKLYTTLDDARNETNPVTLTTDSEYRMWLHLAPNI